MMSFRGVLLDVVGLVFSFFSFFLSPSMKVSVWQLHYTLVLLLGPVDSPSGRKEANEMEVMRRSMLGSKWKAQFVVGGRTYRTGNWLAGEGERGNAEAGEEKLTAQGDNDLQLPPSLRPI